MSITLGHTQYGKDEIRVVRIVRGDDHDIHDYQVGVSLVGDYDAAHTTGDNRTVTPTDTAKNTTFAHALDDDEVTSPEAYGLGLARHFVRDVDPVQRARISLEEYSWTRLAPGGDPDPHAFVRTGGMVRTATVTADADTTWVVSGIDDLTLLKTTDSEFEGFLVDEYTTLQPARDRILATTVSTQWLHAGRAVDDWNASFEAVRTTLLDAFADHYSHSLQETIWTMGRAVLDARPSITEIRFTCPNSHHFLVDMEPIGLDNPDLVFHADDRPYGMIEGTVRRDDGPDPGPAAFDPGQGW